MKAWGRRPRAFIVFECLETPVKHEARVFEMASESAPNGKQKKKRKQKNRRTQNSHKHVIFAFFCLISAQFVMIMPVFFTTEACLFQVVTTCLYSPALKVHSTKTSGPLRFSELGKQRGSKNSVYLTRKACSKMTIFTVCEVSKRSWRTWLVFP